MWWGAIAERYSTAWMKSYLGDACLNIKYSPCFQSLLTKHFVNDNSNLWICDQPLDEVWGDLLIDSRHSFSQVEFPAEATNRSHPKLCLLCWLMWQTSLCQLSKHLQMECLYFLASPDDSQRSMILTKSHCIIFSLHFYRWSLVNAQLAISQGSCWLLESQSEFHNVTDIYCRYICVKRLTVWGKFLAKIQSFAKSDSL